MILFVFLAALVLGFVVSMIARNFWGLVFGFFAVLAVAAVMQGAVGAVIVFGTLAYWARR